MAVLEASRLTGCNSIPSFIAGGSRMIFNMATCPTSWTKDTGNNQFTLRVVNGTVSPGGTKTVPQVFTSTFPVSGQTAPSSFNFTVSSAAVPVTSIPSTASGTIASSLNLVPSSAFPPHTHSYQRANTGTPSGSGTPSAPATTPTVTPTSTFTATNFTPAGGGGQHSHNFDTSHTHTFPATSPHTHAIGPLGPVFPTWNQDGFHLHPYSASFTFDLKYVDVIIASKN